MAVYNEAMAEHDLAIKPMTRKVREALQGFASFCRSHQIDPARWVRARHEAIGWRFRVPIERLASQKFVAKFRSFGDDRQAHIMHQQHLAKSLVDDTPRDGAHLICVCETTKAYLVSEPEVCMLSPDVTGGWNPRSDWCSECPIASRCRDLLPDTLRASRDHARRG